MSTKNAPIYVQFCAAVQSRAIALGYQREEKAGWVNFVHPSTEHKFSIQRSVTDLPRIETTLDIPLSAPETVEKIELNGRMRTVLVPTPQVVIAALEMGADPATPKTLSRRQKGAKAAPLLADLLASTFGAEEPAAEEQAEEVVSE